MPLSIKVNLRVTGHCNQGGRKYMEDMFSVAYQQTSDDKDLEYAFFGIFDGHGGGEAATFAKEHLMDIIVKQKNFWSDKDEDVLRAIRDGYVNTHYAMWRELEKWPRTASGLPSTAGTTASIAFIRKGKIYIGHVGDSGIILGYQEKGDPQWKAKALTRDHKPESLVEMTRIQESGGKVVSKSGVPRVVWNRPRIGHKGPVRRSTHIDEIPFLAVARSLGDLWSYNSELDTFVVSPEPDVKVITVDVESHRCLIFGTDGLWNMLTPQAAVAIVQAAERHNEKHFIASQQTGHGTDTQMWINPSKSLVDRALERWSSTRLRADNTSVVTLMLDPPGPSRGEVLLSRKKERVSSPKCVPVPPLHYTNPTFYNGKIERPTNTVNPQIPVSPKIENSTVNVQPERPVTPVWIVHADIVKHNVQQNCNPPVVETKTFTSDQYPRSEVQERVEVKNDSIIEESTTLESIQVAEISSSDTSSDEIAVPIVDNVIPPPEPENLNTSTKNKPNITETSPVSNTLALETKPKIEKSIDTKKFIENDKDLRLMRQNAFPELCDKFKCGPRLTRSTTGLPENMMLQAESHYTENMRKTLTPDPARRHQHGKSLESHLEKCPVLLGATRSELRSTKRRQGATNGPSQVMPATSSSYVDDRQKMLVPPVEPRLKRETALRPGATTRTVKPANTKRRHSSTFEAPEEAVCSSQEPFSKRRTRSEDRPCPTDENNPVNQGQRQPQHNRLYWPVTCSMGSRLRNGAVATTSCQSTGITVNTQEKIPSPNSFQRRSLEKKATPVKTIRRPSINGSSRVQLRGSFALRDWDQAKSSRRASCSNDRPRLNRSVNGSTPESASSTPQRWLRSDTIAATPIKTLRSRNVDITGHTVPPQIAHQYGIVKPNRLSLSAKIKISNLTKVKSTASLTANKLKQAAGGNIVGTNGSAASVSANVSGIAKRVKSSPYNPSARSLGTRSRLKRLSK